MNTYKDNERLTVDQAFDSILSEGVETHSTETISFTLNGTTAELDIENVEQSVPLVEACEGSTMNLTTSRMGEFRIDGKVADCDGDAFPRELVVGLLNKVIAAYPAFKKQEAES